MKIVKTALTPLLELLTHKRTWLAILAVCVTIAQAYGLDPKLVQAVQAAAVILIGAFTINGTKGSMVGGGNGSS